ncbi:MAG: transposase, partial [Deltaproteobacteria bacterium]
RLNEEIKRRTRVVRIFPNSASCIRLIRALCVETHEGWLEATGLSGGATGYARITTR